jgi:hypothetical protein
VEVFILQPISYLTVDPLPVTGYDIDDQYRIGNDAPTVDAIAHGKFAEPAGTLDTFQLAKTPTYAYVATRYREGALDQDTALDCLHNFIFKTQLLALGLWFVKDNSANPYRAYFRMDDGDGPHFLSDVFSTYFYTADCELRNEHFSKDEFDKGVSFYRKLNAVIPKVPQDETRISGLIHDSRIARTLYFLQAGRNTADLLVRIAFYCMCLESLFSTDKAGVTHRVSERTAVFLGRDGTARRAIYADIHTLYSTRSTVVHGAHVKPNKLPELIQLTRKGDEYLRRCLTQVLDDPALLDLFTKGAAKAVDNHFVDSLFPL